MYLTGREKVRNQVEHKLLGAFLQTQVEEVARSADGTDDPERAGRVRRERRRRIGTFGQLDCPEQPQSRKQRYAARRTFVYELIVGINQQQVFFAVAVLPYDPGASCILYVFDGPGLDG